MPHPSPTDQAVMPRLIQRFSDPGQIIATNSQQGQPQTIMRQQSLPGRQFSTEGKISTTTPATRVEFREGLRRLGRRSITARDREAVSMPGNGGQLRVSAAPSRLSLPSTTVADPWLPAVPKNSKRRLNWNISGSTTGVNQTGSTNFRHGKFLESVCVVDNNAWTRLITALQQTDTIAIIVNLHCGEHECAICTPDQKVFWWKVGVGEAFNAVVVDDDYEFGDCR